MKLVFLIAVLAATVAFSTQAAATPIPCTYGAPNGTGSTTLGLSGSTATVNVAWSFCGVGTSAVIHLGGQTFNGTSAQLALSPGQCVSASADIYAGGEFWTTQQSTPSSVCAPSSSGGGSSPPINMSTPLTTGSIVQLGGTDNDNVRLLLNNTPYTCLYRWKTRIYQANYGSLLGGLNFKITYGVCYQPGVKVFFATAWYASVGSSVTSAFSWQTYNDNGFPTVMAFTTQAIFHWQGSAAICLTQWGCGPTRHPALSITFNVNGTETKSESVG